MSSLKSNVIWNLIRVGSNMLFPIITLPYINRVLGAYNIGLYNYIYSIVNYFILFAGLGFPLFGTREVTRYRDNAEALENRVNSIFTTLIIFALLITSIYVIFVVILHADKIGLCFILGTSILLSSISFEWFYQGIEDFKYITIRSLVFKIASIIALFIFVRDNNDLLLYAIINILAIFGSNILNCIRLNHFIKLRLHISGLIYNIKGSSILFVGSIIASFYTQINTVMLGALGSVVAVAYYSTSEKFIQICNQILNSISMVIMPRISYLASNSQKENTVRLQKLILNIINLLTVPMAVGLFFLAEDIIHCFAGAEFLPAIFILKSLSLTVVLIPLSIYFSFHILYPIGKEKYTNYCTLTAAIVNVLLNVIFIPIISYYSVVISVNISESIVMGMLFVFSKRFVNIGIKDIFSLKVTLSSVIMALMICSIPEMNHVISLIVKTILGCLIYTSSLILLKDSTFLYLLDSLHLNILNINNK